MATSELEICNAALARLGTGPISSLSGTDKASTTCNLFYARTRDSLLRSHPWNFALKRAELVEDIDTPAFGYSNQFLLPDDYLRAVRLDDTSIEFKIEGGLLLANSSEIKLQYIALIDDVDLFEPMFEHLLMLQLAHEMSYSLVQSVSLKSQLAQEIQIVLRDVRSADAQEGTPDSFEYNTWIESRI